MTLRIANLSKTYNNGVKALDNVNLEIGAGMFGLLGPNGAGKSSLLRTVATLQSPDAGSITFNGIEVLQDPMRLRKILGYLPQEFGVYPKMSAEDLLDYFATLKGIASRAERARLIREVLEITNLFEVRKKHVEGYSGGMKQRFGIAQLLLNHPQLIQLTPAQALKEIDGQIWTMSITRERLEEMETRYNVLSSKYNPDNSINIRVHAAQKPAPDFTAAAPQLEDAYFIALKVNSESDK